MMVRGIFILKVLGYASVVEHFEAHVWGKLKAFSDVHIKWGIFIKSAMSVMQKHGVGGCPSKK